jgi:AraC-like DNA-binding protein
MGQLVAKCYPTRLFANLADHTYVQCGTGGRAWSCWGGKTGGSELRRSPGSTKRANQIADTDERAGITCYLVNGVCHQAANRILFPASVTVRGARGYDVSEALFGTYGRPGGVFGLCKAPFDQHSGVTGDLAACTGPAPRSLRQAPGGRSRRVPRSAAAAAREKRYLARVLQTYKKVRAPLANARASRRLTAGRDLEAFHVELFMLQVDFTLGSKADQRLKARLADVRRSTERSRLKIEEWFANRELSPREFATEFDRETLVFQDATASVMARDKYQALFGLKPDERIVLADPRIVRRAFKRRVR